MMDTRSLVMSLARLGKAEAALEVYELLSLEEQRTGRVGDNPAWDRVREDVTSACHGVDAGTVQRAASRARSVPIAERADRVIELAHAAASADRAPSA